MKVEIQSLHKQFDKVAAVQNLDLTVNEGEFVVILGPSGCGKTTTLRCVAGLEYPDGGSIRIGNRTVVSPRDRVFVPPEQRNLGMVFQSYAVWPHMTVFRNVAYPLHRRGVAAQEVRSRVAQILEMVGLSGLEERPASNLSGGQMQRVALARALVFQPAALLLDEPLSNLDQQLRQRLRVELKEIQRSAGATSIYVTHDRSEAAILGDRVVVMNEGRVVQVSPPEELFLRPANRFVADFLGVPNLLPCTVLGAAGAGRHRIRLGSGLELSATANVHTGGTVQWVWFASDAIQVLGDSPTADDSGAMVARVVTRLFTGTNWEYQLALEGAPGEEVRITYSPTGSEGHLEVGGLARIRVPPGQAHLVSDQ